MINIDMNITMNSIRIFTINITITTTITITILLLLIVLSIFCEYWLMINMIMNITINRLNNSHHQYYYYYA